MEKQEITQNLKVMIMPKCGCPLKHQSSDFNCPGTLGRWVGIALLGFKALDQQ